MGNHLNFITEELRLKQSQLYGDSYSEIENKFVVPTYNDLSIHTLKDWENSLINSYDLNEVQTFTLSEFLKQLNYVLKTIDPLKIESIRTSTIDETDLLVWRETSKFIVELTFDEDGFVIFRKTFKTDKEMQKGIFNSDSDFQWLLLQFLS
ncbi:MAG: hypothetical protein WBG71_01900 [Leeuwenhoekiella sp.]